MKQDSKWVLIVGLIISVISISLAFFEIKNWYFSATIGVWLVFDYFSSKKNKTAFQYLLSDRVKFINLYLLMLFLGSTIELFGRFIFGFWHYSSNSVFLNILITLNYPFILFSFREMYKTIGLKFKKSWVKIILSMILGIVIWEFPNLFSKDWIYTIPYINLEIFGINIVVILGWIILIVFPLYIYSIIENQKLKEMLK